MDINLTKKQIRQGCLTQRRALTSGFITQASYKIIEQIRKIQVYITATSVAYYFPTNGEVDLSLLWRSAIKDEKSCYFPSIQDDKTLLFLPYTLHTPCHRNHFGILEPDVPLNQAKHHNEIALIILPVVAFDQSLLRLGMGGGFYDKTLRHHHTTTLIGVAYEWQKYHALPADIWDVKLDMIVTEKTIYT